MGEPVRTSLWDEAAEAAMGHIELARWPTVVVIAPATANTLAKLAHGLADDLVSTLFLATDAPIAVAPAMHRLMRAHPATRANMDTLRGRDACAATSARMSGVRTSSSVSVSCPGCFLSLPGATSRGV